MPLVGNVDKITRSYVAGWLADPDNPQQPIDVLIYVNGEGRGRIKADLTRDDLLKAFPGATGRHAFRFEFGWPLSPFRQNEVEIIDGREHRALPGGRQTLAPLGGQQPKTSPIPLCVTSTGRTGTSLLMGRLASHPEIGVAGTHPYEVKQLTYYSGALRTLSLEANWNRSMHADALVSEASRYTIGFNPFHDSQFGQHALLDRYWQVTAPEVLTSAFRTLILQYYDAVRAATNKVRIQFFAEKTHPTPLIRDGAVAMFGAVKEIMLVRDPRDVVCSYRAFWGRNPAEAVSLIHSQFAELSKRIDLHENESLLVRYEDLVLNRAEVLRTIFSFLELQPGLEERSEAEATIFSKHGTSGSPELSVGRWRQELTKEEKKLCEKTFADLLPVLGYGSSGANLR